MGNISLVRGLPAPFAIGPGVRCEKTTESPGPLIIKITGGQVWCARAIAGLRTLTYNFTALRSAVAAR